MIPKYSRGSRFYGFRNFHFFLEMLTQSLIKLNHASDTKNEILFGECAKYSHGRKPMFRLQDDTDVLHVHIDLLLAKAPFSNQESNKSKTRDFVTRRALSHSPESKNLIQRIDQNVVVPVDQTLSFKFRTAKRRTNLAKSTRKQWDT